MGTAIAPPGEFFLFYRILGVRSVVDGRLSLANLELPAVFMVSLRLAGLNLFVRTWLARIA